MENIVATIHYQDQHIDVEIPTNITCDELLQALNQAFRNEVEPAVALRADNPIAYLSGEAMVYEFDLHHGSDLYFIEE